MKKKTKVKGKAIVEFFDFPLLDESEKIGIKIFGHYKNCLQCKDWKEYYFCPFCGYYLGGIK